MAWSSEDETEKKALLTSRPGAGGLDPGRRGPRRCTRRVDRFLEWMVEERSAEI